MHDEKENNFIRIYKKRRKCSTYNVAFVDFQNYVLIKENKRKYNYNATEKIF